MAAQDKPLNRPQDAGSTAQGVVQQVQDKASHAYDTVKDTAQSLAHNVADYATHAKDNVGDAYSQAKHKVQDLASGAADQMGHARERAMEYGSQAYDSTSDAMKTGVDQLTSTIRQHPIPAILIGFGVGFLLAQLIDRGNS